MARTVGLTDKAFYTAAHQARRRLRRRARPGVRQRALGGAERVLAVDDRRRDRRPRRRRAAIAEKNGDAAGARIYRATADHYQRNIKGWTVTTNGPLSAEPYFIRLSKTGDPNARDHLQPRQRRPRRRPARRSSTRASSSCPGSACCRSDDADVARSLAARRRGDPASTSAPAPASTATAPPTPGTEDGYGDCHVADPTDCAVAGQAVGRAPATAQGQNKGSGHLWPVLAGERAEHEIATGSPTRPARLWASMAGMRRASG